MNKLIINNIKTMWAAKYKFIIISCILGLAFSIFVVFNSSMNSQKSSIISNEQKVNIEDFLVNSNNISNYDYQKQIVDHSYSEKYNTIRNNFYNYFAKNYPNHKDIKFNYEIREEYSFYDYDDISTFSPVFYNFISEGFDAKPTGISKDNLLNKSLSEYNGDYYEAYVSQDWAKRHDLFNGSNFLLGGKQFKIMGWVNSAFYATGSPSQKRCTMKSYLCPYIIVNRLDYSSLIQEWRYPNAVYRTYFLNKFEQSHNANDTENFIKIFNYYVKHFSIIYQINIPSISPNNVNSFVKFEPFLDGVYDNYSTLNYATYRLGAFFMTLKSERYIVNFLVIAILIICLFIYAIIIKSRIEADRFQIGVLKSSGYTTWQIGASWIGSAIASFFLTLLATSVFIIPALKINYMFFHNIFASQVTISSVSPSLFIFTSFTFLAILCSACVLLAAFFSRHNVLKLLSQKKQYSLNWMGGMILKCLQFLPFSARFAVSSFISSGFRSIIFLGIILGGCLLLVGGILLYQIVPNIVNTYNSNANYNYDYTKKNVFMDNDNKSWNDNNVMSELPNTNSNINYDLKLYNYQTTNNTIFQHQTSLFYHNQASPIIFNINYKNGNFNIIKNDYFFDLLNFLFQNSNHNDIIKEKLFINANSLVFNNEKIFLDKNIDNADLWIISKDIFTYIHSQSKYYRISQNNIDNLLHYCRSYFQLVNHNSRINLGFYLHQNNEDNLLFKVSNYVNICNSANIKSLHSKNLINDPFISNDKSIPPQQYRKVDVKTLILNQTENNYSDFKKIDLSYGKNSEYVNNLIETKNEIPVSINQKTANLFNLHQGSTISSEVYNLLNQTLNHDFYTHIHIPTTPNHSGLKYYIQNVLNNKVWSTSRNKNYTKQYYFFISDNVMNVLEQHLWNNLDPKDKDTLKNQDGIAYDSGNWTDYTNSFTDLNSLSTLNYSFNCKNSEISLLPDHQTSFALNDQNNRFSKDESVNDFSVLTLTYNHYLVIQLLLSILSIYEEIFVFLLFICLIIAILAIIILNVIFIEDNKNNVALLKIFGYNDSIISQLYMLIVLPIMIVAYFISIIVSIIFIHFFIIKFAGNLGLSVGETYNYLYFIFAFIFLLFVYFISSLIIQRIIHNAKAIKIISDKS